MRSFVAAMIFRIIQIVLLPIGAVGYVLLVVKLVRFKRRTGTSATVLASLYTRYMQHRLGTRRDQACERLMAVLPNVPPLGLALETAPTLVAHRLTGYVPRIYRYPYEGVTPTQASVGCPDYVLIISRPNLLSRHRSSCAMQKPCSIWLASRGGLASTKLHR
jgi:hypothetical protein